MIKNHKNVQNREKNKLGLDIIVCFTVGFEPLRASSRNAIKVRDCKIDNFNHPI